MGAWVKRLAGWRTLAAGRLFQQTLCIENDYVIAATGYQPNFDLLEQLGVALSDDGRKTPVYNPETQESNQPGIYLAGVVCGGLDTHVWFIENSRVHAGRIVQSVLKGK